jgi:hypothetical protein
MKFFRLAALGAALVYLSDATRRAKLRDRVLGLIGGARKSADVEASGGDVDVSDDLEQRVRTVQGEDSDEKSKAPGTETPATS